MDQRLKNDSIVQRPVFHLVCNAHLDPVWLWEWEEGAAAAISTFRTAADLCEAFDGFVFNHNEVIIYRWVEEYEPALFERIQRLVREGKWHIMGGWYLQPDCNMPSGESFVRQILLGRRYFAEKFGARPTTAINFDPFGHTRGLVQIMAKSGFTSYLFCRPSQNDCPLEDNAFIWEGYDGSRVLGYRPNGFYNSGLGKARAKVESFLANGAQAPDTLLLWGVGDHGGGPSFGDLKDLTALIQTPDQPVEVRHSTPEAFFEALARRAAELPVHRADLNPWGVGCYTSMARIKHKHRRLENELFAVEKMVSAAWARGLLAYPQVELQEAQRDLANAEFHDILPGSAIQPVEEMALRLMDHGLEILARLKARAFFSLALGQPKAKENEIPILVYNPHPYLVRSVVECEFQLADINWQGEFTDIQVYQAEQALPTQVEKEASNLNIDWRKRVAFEAELAPSQMNRFDCRLILLPKKPARPAQTAGQPIHFQTDDLEVIINPHSGLIDRYRAGGVDYLAANAFCPMVMFDNSDPWGMLVRRYRNHLGTFTLLNQDANLRFSAVKNPGLPAVRVIEDGAVRMVVEAVLGYGDSTLCLRYKLPKRGREIEVEARVHWNEKDRMLKLSIPTLDSQAVYMGQVAYGVDNLPANGDEVVAQKWTAIVSHVTGTAITIINDGVYGSDYCLGEARLSLLRSPAYSGHPIMERPILPQDRYSPRIDQGERLFHFWICGGTVVERLAAIDLEAQAHNEQPMALSFFPVGTGSQPGAFLTLDDPAIRLGALKQAEDGDGLIVRLFNSTSEPRQAILRLPGSGWSQPVALKGYEIRSFHLNPHNGDWNEVNLIEEPV